MSAGEIARHAGLATASVTNLVDRLERKGFVPLPVVREDAFLSLGAKDVKTSRSDWEVPGVGSCSPRTWTVRVESTSRLSL
jgi:hypothetical protein